MTGTSRGRLRVVLVFSAVLLLMLAPAIDSVAFGLHEHVVAPERSSNLSGPGDTQSPTLSHHCELSASGADLVSVVTVPALVRLALVTLEQRVAAPPHRPFVPLTPPRA